MTAKLRSWWQKIKQHPFITAGIVVTIFALIVFTLAVSKFGWDWTGFTGGESKITITSTSKVITTAKELQPAKAFWDWLGLLAALAIPVVVGFGAAWFTAQQGKVSERENKDNQREAALQAYIDKMSELLLDKGLRKSAEDDEVCKIARARTLTVLLRLDRLRKRTVLQFLHESGLIHKDKSIVILSGADLSEADLSAFTLIGKLTEYEDEIVLNTPDQSGADFRGDKLAGVNLRGADLKGTNLTGADLRGADLRGADLRYAILAEADLSEADLNRANLYRASLRGADLSGAHLFQADLSDVHLNGTSLRGAELTKALVTDEQLSEALSLTGTTMPDGSKHP